MNKSGGDLANDHIPERGSKGNFLPGEIMKQIYDGEGKSNLTKK